jgi:hypothetical protein
MPVLALNGLPCVTAGWTIDEVQASQWRRLMVRHPPWSSRSG